MNSRHLIDRFLASRERGDSMVMVTVYDTLGSTYSKAGTRMLIIDGGGSEGLISGGCLEGDLAARARKVLETHTAMAVTYDLRDESDELFGLGVGCNGLIRVLLQPLSADSAYQPMAAIAGVLLGEHNGGIGTVIESGRADCTAGAAVVVAEGIVTAFGVPAEIEPRFAAGIESAGVSRVARLVSEPDGSVVLYAPLAPIPRILILGAGLDAVPLVNVIAELGWRVTLADHRPGYLERNGFGRAEERHVVRPETLAGDLPLANFDAIVVMSHHLATDREYLRQLAANESTYLGLLGPPARKRRLLDELGDAGRVLETRLRGPVGIDIGADSAESIALSIAAEMQAVLVRGAV
jgi:xanthine/CO dehydrogenase XdhC/CoxF family maturation factor